MPLSLADVDLSKLDLGENPESLVISEVEGDEGTAQVVYRSGGRVSIGELEALCERVGWPPRPAEKVKGALENSFLVRALHREAAHQVWPAGIPALCRNG